MQTIEVVDRRSSAVLRIPIQQVFFVPTPTQAQDKTKKKPAGTRLYLCDANDAAATSFSWCPLLGACNGVHANTCGAGNKQIHINFAYKSPSDCQYPRLAADCVVGVREPVSARSANVDTVAAECILVTRCRIGPGHAMTRCAHFYYGRECHLGANCDFAHVIHINPNARQLELAPTPSSVGRGREASDPATYGVYGEQQLHLALACRAAATPNCEFAHVIHLDPTTTGGERAPAPASFGRGRDASDDAAAAVYGQLQFALARSACPAGETVPGVALDASVESIDASEHGTMGALSSLSTAGTASAPSHDTDSHGVDVLKSSLPLMKLSAEAGCPVWWSDEKPVAERSCDAESLLTLHPKSRHNPYA